MAKTVAESEIFYERVKSFFWRENEADFIVRLSDAPMKHWNMIPTPSTDEVSEVRFRFVSEDAEFSAL